MSRLHAYPRSSFPYSSPDPTSRTRARDAFRRTASRTLAVPSTFTRTVSTGFSMAPGDGADSGEVDDPLRSELLEALEHGR